jgi:predicted ATPase/DNA-binding SARP family transcriptional activator
MDGRWRIELLGGLRARLGERVVDRFATRKIAALLGYLAYHREQAATREQLVFLLWPRAQAAAGRTSLRKALSSLRRQLEPPGVPEGAVIAADRLSVRLREETTSVDAVSFRELAANALRERGAEARARRCHEAVLAYPGDLLPGHDDEWVVRERERLGRLFREAVRVSAAGLERAGDPEAAIALLRRALAADPLHEDLQRDLVRLLGAGGDLAAALRQLREVERIFRRELRAPLSPELRALALDLERRMRAPPGSHAAAPPPDPPVARRSRGLVTVMLVGSGAGEGERTVELDRPADALPLARELLAGGAPVALDLVATGDQAGLERARSLLGAANPGQVLASERVAPQLRAALATDAAWLLDRGSYRLGAGPTPERVFEVRDPAGPGTPAPRARAAREGSLPLRATRFFGREAELAWLATVLEPGRSSLVTLTGPGGIGKTRLALEAAAEARARFPGGAWFVPLALVADPRRVVEAVAAAARVLQGSDGAPLDALAAAFGDDPALFLLDNLEQLGADGAAAVATLLERLPRASFVVTTRERLGLENELERVLGPLALPGAARAARRSRSSGAATVADAAGFAGVRLFLDRARQVKPDFELTPRNAAAILELCRRLDGVPLALELAAGRVLVLPPARLLERIDERLDLLVSRRRDAPARHRTLRAAIESSAQLLSPALARVFSRLSVFRGSFTAQAAGAVCGDGPVLPAIERLVECSLLVAEPGTSDGDDEPRFRYLEAIRAFAGEQLDAEGRAGAARRHAEHFEALAARARPELRGDRQAEVARRLEADHDELRAAFAWSLEPRGDLALGYRLGLSLERFWNMRGHLREGRRLLDELLARKGGPPDLRAKALVGAGAFAGNLGDLEAARARFAEAVSLLRQVDAPGELAFTLNNLGVVAMALGDRDAASLAIEESVAIGRRSGAAASLGTAVAPSLVTLAQIALADGALGRARGLLEESVAILREAGDLFRLEHSLFELGRIARWEGDDERADASLVESLEVCERIGDERSESYARIQRAGIALERGLAPIAREWAEAALLDLERLGDRSGTAGALAALGAVELEAGKLGEARKLLERSLALSRELDSPGATVEALGRLGVLALRQDEPARARESFAAGLEAAAKSREALPTPGLLEGAAAALVPESRFADAARLLGAAREHRDRMGTPGRASERARLEATEAAARAGLGARRFSRASAEGRGLSLVACLDLVRGRAD